MSTDVAAQEILPKDSTFHLDAGIEDPEEFLAVHELMNRGQLLNAYEVWNSIFFRKRTARSQGKSR